ncbi:MAG: sugar phosphate isomerase/epimerase [Treponema sp.]|jgi:sugar phosphate isomerase/epimerase|nr:sugar phosphate isomerase/epimerase [Treponema sp.]
MKFGICTNMHGTKEDPIGLWLIENAVRDGFDYVELPEAQLMDLDQNEFDRLCEKLSTLGMQCLRNNNFFPLRTRLTGPDVNETEIKDYIERALARSQALGVKKVVFGSGPARNVPQGFSLDEGRRQIVRLLRDFASIAEKSEITIVIEPLNRTESNIINSFEEGCGISSEVSRENVKVLVDYYHLLKENEPLEHIYQKGRPFLSHAHLAGDGSARQYPTAANKDGYIQFFKALKAAAYDDTISLEAYDDDPPLHMKATLEMIHKLWEKS